ncbi:MAG: hypothetical protein WB297_16710, partial [Actinomycetota bacterium]
LFAVALFAVALFAVALFAVALFTVVFLLVAFFVGTVYRPSNVVLSCPVITSLKAPRGKRLEDVADNVDPQVPGNLRPSAVTPATPTLGDDPIQRIAVERLKRGGAHVSERPGLKQHRSGGLCIGLVAGLTGWTWGGCGC